MYIYIYIYTHIHTKVICVPVRPLFLSALILQYYGLGYGVGSGHPGPKP